MDTDTLKIFSHPTRTWFTDTFGVPTKVQEESWPAIASNRPVLVSAPTGTGKTLSAFLVFIDQLNTLARDGELKEELYLIYVSPLKSLAADIRENLRRPLDGIPKEEGQTEIAVAIRTGDTPQKDRQRMIKHPPHILIITPESLYLMLTSKSGRSVLKTAGALIIDELHALIDTKRGAHLMLSLARLDQLCGKPLQRIGLSATIEPLELAAEYLSPEPVVICAPVMEKKVRIEVVGTTPADGRRKDPVWEELGMAVYRKCLDCKSVIAFSEGRRYVEKLAYYVNLLGGDGFARVHHGSLSKEQRAVVEQDLREGRLRLLCATSSMELGIDVGDVELVLQVGCPRTISGTMQRLGRAGHNPGRVSVMYMYPRTAAESIACGMTAEIARQGGVEHTHPPRMCLDVLAQHLVSMAAGDPYTVESVMEMVCRAYPFRDLTIEDVRAVLRMLAGDYEHSREIPVRPRLLYDRIHDQVSGDAYSRMLAVTAGGTIPDKGMYTAKTEDGVKLGELDEEFVYESYIGDKFMLGSFGWKIIGQDKDTVIVTQVSPEGARLPFWKGETRGRSLRTSLAFGRIFRQLGGEKEERLQEALEELGLDEGAAAHGAGLLKRQIQTVGCLPDDKTIVVEHFRDSTGSHQIMVHAMFGRRVNAPLALLFQQAVSRVLGIEVGCVDEEDGFLIYPYGKEQLPDGLLQLIQPERAGEILEAVLPVTPLFSLTFRYNAARALMMGMRQGGRQPLWMQRLRSTEMLDSLMGEKQHPLIRETKRECLEEQWDIAGVQKILSDIRAGLIVVREVHPDMPSPMSLPFQWKVEAAEMYEYSPVTTGIRQAVSDELKQVEMMKPLPEELAKGQERKKQPENEAQLHSLLMMEGDFVAGEVEVPARWLETLADRGQALYIEPGLWIAAEHAADYAQALAWTNEEAADREMVLTAALPIVRRMLYYRGGQTAEAVMERYFMDESLVKDILEQLCQNEEIVESEDFFYHRKRYDRAREASIRSLRMETTTRPPEHYAALMADRAARISAGEEQLKQVIGQYCGSAFPVRFWETILFAGRVRQYSESMLDKLLAQGDYFWKMSGDGDLCFCRYEDIDWESPIDDGETLVGDEQLMYRELKRRGASFLKFLTEIPKENSAQNVLLSLAEKGLVCADSFVPVRQWMNKEKMKKATPRQRVSSRVMALSAGRWDVVRPVKARTGEEWLEVFFREHMILCRETFRRSLSAIQSSVYTAADRGSGEGGWSWRQALEILRIWEYTGKIRRGYFVSGMSGAQFIRAEDYSSVTAALREPETQIVWLAATDPAQVWGKVLEQPEERGFLVVPGTVVALRNGAPVAVLERKGKTLRVFSFQDLEEVLSVFVRDFKRGMLFPGQKRLTVKEYPEESFEALKNAGFMKEMRDYVLYR